MRPSELNERLDSIEQRLQGLQHELAEVRRLAAAVAEDELQEPVPEPAAVPLRLLDRAWRELERGRPDIALELALDALAEAEAAGDADALAELAALAAAAEQTAPPALRYLAVDLADRVGRRRSRPAQVEAPEPAWTPDFAPPPRGPSAAERLTAFARAELAGPRAFALAGGVVTLLGVVFLFVLAANRGWIGPAARLSIGAVASLALLAAGVLLRARFGRLQASLAAAGTGVAGSYTTLAAATIIYGYLPSWGALLVAAGIAATGSALATRWSSEILAGLSLVGAAAAPGLVALDDGIGAPGTAFAVIVLASALAVSATRRWLWLALAVAVVSLGQVAWLTGAAQAGDSGAIAVAAAASAVLLGGALAWQAGSRTAGLDRFAGTLSLAGGGLALGSLAALLPSDRQVGVALLAAGAVYAAVGLAGARSWRELGWVDGAVALTLAGVATSYLLSEHTLTIAWAAEAAALAVPAWRLGAPRFQLASLAYLAVGGVHVLVVEVADATGGDVPRTAAPGFLALAGAALVVGVLAPRERRDEPAAGVLAGLEPLWDALTSNRGTLRMLLWIACVAWLSAGMAALLSGRWLTIASAALAAALAAAAFGLGERRLQGGALAFLVLGVLHALAVEAPLETLAPARELDAVAPVPSLVALTLATAVLSALAVFDGRGIAFLGRLEGSELWLQPLAVGGTYLRGALAAAASWAAAWSVGLLLVAWSYEAGNAAATAVWTALGVALAVLAARRRSDALLYAAVPPVLLGFGKAALFDWPELGELPGGAAMLTGAAGLLLLGYLARYALAGERWPVESISLVTATVAAASALAAVDHIAPDRPQVLGAAGLAVAIALALLAAVPHRAWLRDAQPEPWLRNLATVHWAVALATTGFAELSLVDADAAATAALWALTAVAAATAARPLGEVRLWLAGASAALLTTVVCISAVTVPSRLFVATERPGSGLWALAACVAALAWLSVLAPQGLRWSRAPMGLLAAGLALFGLSLGVLDVAERVSGASVATDFQRGHTAVSALWGVLALALFVLGLLRSERIVQRVGLALFVLALAKLFLYDLRSLSSITRALSFLAVGAILLAAAFFVERIVHRGRSPEPGTAGGATP